MKNHFPVGKIAKEQSEGVHSSYSANLSKIHSYRLLFRLSYRLLINSRKVFTRSTLQISIKNENKNS